MSNERCRSCEQGDHDNCAWVAGLCPFCGPDGCLTPQYGPGNPPPEDETWAANTSAQFLALRSTIAPALTPQDALLDALDDLLDGALHAPECWISPTETNCECLIGKVRAVLPHCDAIVVSETTGQSYRCVRVAHPAAPNSHVFY